MKAVILCGGKGTRIRDVSDAVPKPMLNIGNRPILWHIMKCFANHQISDFVLCLGYKGWLIKEFFLNYRAMTSDLTVALGASASVTFHESTRDDWRVTLAETGEETMTGGRVAAVKRHLADDDLFLLTYGDGVSDVDIGKLVAFHKAHGKVATLTAVRPPSRFGELTVEDRQITHFSEKPRATGGLINGGYFVCDGRRIWDYLGEDPATVLEREPLQKLAREGQLMAYEHLGFWEPMDTYREYLLLNELWARGEAPWKTWKDTP
jgi:glucose-1-phosphate cytidylyltransferase